MIKSECRRIHLRRREPHLPRPIQGLLPVHNNGAVLKKDGYEGMVQAAGAAGIACVRHDGHIGRRDLIAQRCLEAAWSFAGQRLSRRHSRQCANQKGEDKRAVIPFVHVPFTNVYSSNWWLTS